MRITVHIDPNVTDAVLLDCEGVETTADLLRAASSLVKIVGTCVKNCECDDDHAALSALIERAVEAISAAEAGPSAGATADAMTPPQRLH